MALGVAILGGGIFAREEHKPAVEAAPDLVLKAVYSRSLASAKSLEVDEAKVDLYSDDSGDGKSLDDLLARKDIHAVTIALPIKHLAQYIRKALVAGKHVLSEKPVAENVKEAEELIKWYRSSVHNATWSVGENFRYLNSFDRARDVINQSGRVLNFRCRVQSLVAGGKYFETEWRKVPTHQGGFLLDGGVHFVAGVRLLLGPENPLVSVSAFTTQLQNHLPPVDTIEAIAKAKNGAVGSISISVGTTYRGFEFVVACEKGFVIKNRDQVTVGDKTETIQDERTGVPPEVREWGKALVAGKSNAKQSPEEALADLEILEAMLRSGEQGGLPVTLHHQNI